MKNYILVSIFFCLFVTTATITAVAYSQDRSPSTSSDREGERTQCILSSGAMKAYVEQELDRINKENPK